MRRKLQNRKRLHGSGLGASGICSLVLFFTPAIASPTVTTFSIPGALDTVPLSINKHGKIAGYYTVSGGADHGFLRKANGAIVSIDAPAATDTTVVSINDADATTGFWRDANGTHGFVRDPAGMITSFDAGQPGGATYPTSINRGGTVAGYIAYFNNQPVDGFSRAPGGAITIFDPAGYTVTFAQAIDRIGAIAGRYEDGTGADHGFIRHSGGAFTLFDPLASELTFVNGINNSGDVAGYYFDGNSTHGFVRIHGSGAIAAFDPPGLSNSHVQGIDDAGNIAGYSFLGGNIAKGFVRRPNGSFAVFHVTGATETDPQAISRGNVTGYYLDNTGAHGFLRTP